MCKGVLFWLKKPLAAITAVDIEISISIQVENLPRMRKWSERDIRPQSEAPAFLIEKNGGPAFIRHAADVEEPVSIDVPDPRAIIGARQVARVDAEFLCSIRKPQFACLLQERFNNDRSRFAMMRRDQIQVAIEIKVECSQTPWPPAVAFEFPALPFQLLIVPILHDGAQLRRVVVHRLKHNIRAVKASRAGGSHDQEPEHGTNPV